MSPPCLPPLPPHADVCRHGHHPPGCAPQPHPRTQRCVGGAVHLTACSMSACMKGGAHTYVGQAKPPAHCAVCPLHSFPPTPPCKSPVCHRRHWKVVPGVRDLRWPRGQYKGAKRRIGGARMAWPGRVGAWGRLQLFPHAFQQRLLTSGLPSTPTCHHPPSLQLLGRVYNLPPLVPLHLPRSSSAVQTTWPITSGVVPGTLAGSRSRCREGAAGETRVLLEGMDLGWRSALSLHSPPFILLLPPVQA